MEKGFGPVIDTAIKREEEAYAFYMDLHGKVENKGAKDALMFIATEEKKHREFLVKYRDGHYSPYALPAPGTDPYRVAQHLEKPDLQKKMDSKDVYLIAAHRELSAHDFYKGLADLHPAGELKDIFLRMANEELKHKEKMEYLYANTAFPQTDGG